MMKRNESTSTRSRFLSGRRLLGTVLSWTGLVFFLLWACPGCSTAYSPEGEPIDMESLREFKPFELPDLSGQTRQLSDYLDKVTVVAFFFPT